jgi:hypothetical protein
MKFIAPPLFQPTPDDHGNKLAVWSLIFPLFQPTPVAWSLIFPLFQPNPVAWIPPLPAESSIGWEIALLR